jgi:glycosyltransferase involved in cell wall biosynthesis
MVQNNQPVITVAVMSYNNARFIGQTIESILEQTGVAFETIVFDDRSSDDTLAVLESFRDRPGFSYVVNEKNLGVTGNYNRCVESGEGRYVVVLGSDDVIYPGHLQSLSAALDLHADAPLAFTQCNWINEHGELIRYAEHPGHPPHSYFGERDEVVDLLRFDNYITPSAVMLRRSVFDQVRLPSGELHRPDLLAGDWELWTRIARYAPGFVFLHQATVGYRVHAGQISNSFYSSERPLAEHTEILEMNLADPAVRERMRASAQAIWNLYLQRASNYPDHVQQKYLDRAKAAHAALFSNAPVTLHVPELSVAPKNHLEENTPLLSIVLTTGDGEEALTNVLASLALQSWRDFEVVVVNDRLESGEHLVAGYDFPMTYVSQTGQGAPEVVHDVGRRVARGRHVVYPDSDRSYGPDHLATLVESLTVG